MKIVIYILIGLGFAGLLRIKELEKCGTEPEGLEVLVLIGIWPAAIPFAAFGRDINIACEEQEA